MSAVSHFSGLQDGARAWAADARARVSAVGPDARTLLHRLSTNHVSALAPGAGCLNAFLTDKGRFVDLALHLDRGAAGVLLVGSAGRGQALRDWLDRYLFTEEVELADLSTSGSCAELAGARAPAIADSMMPGAAGLAPWAFVERDGRLVARGFDRVDSGGARVPSYVVVDLERPAVLDALLAAGAAPLDAQGAEALRIAAGVPGEAGEVVDAHNPLDLALHDAIHWAKGCYIGQEVVARLDTYAKQGKGLVGLVLDDAARARVQPGAEVVGDGKPLGVITSVSPLDNGALPSALAMLKGAPPQGGVQVRLGDASDEPRRVDARLAVRAAAQSPHA